MKIVVLSLFVVIGIYENAFANAPACQGLFLKSAQLSSSANSNLTEELTWTQSLSMEPVTNTVDAIQAIAAHMGPTLKRWNQLLQSFRVENLKMKLLPDSFTKSYFDPLARVINIGIGVKSGEKGHFEAVTAHEFGHSIFDSYFQMNAWKEKGITHKNVTEGAAHEQQTIAQTPQFKNLVNKINQLEQTMVLAKKTNNLDVWARLHSEYQKQLQAFAQLAPYTFSIQQLHGSLIAYNELFADCMAAILIKDPNMVSKAILSHFGGDEIGMVGYVLGYRGANREAKSAPREFSAISFKDWKHELSDAYTSLDPSRGVLWNLYMKNLKDEEIPTFIKTFLSTVANHIEERVEAGQSIEVGNPETDLTALNQRFVRLFVEEAQKNGLQIRK